MLFARNNTEMPTRDTVLPGRSSPIHTAEEHYVFSRPLQGPYPAGMDKAISGLGGTGVGCQVGTGTAHGA